MTFQEAYQIVQNAKNQYRAFERIEEVLILVASSEQAAKEAEARVQGASAAAEGWQKQIEDQRIRFTRETAELTTARDAAAEQHAVALAGFNAEQETLRAEIASLTAQRDTLKAAVAQLKQTAASV